MGREEFASLELLSLYPCSLFKDKSAVFKEIISNDFKIAELENEINHIRDNPSDTPLRTIFTKWTLEGYVRLLKEEIQSSKRYIEYSLMWAAELGMIEESASYIQKYLENRCKKYGVSTNPKTDDWGDSVLRKEIRRRINKPEQLNLDI